MSLRGVKRRGNLVGS